MKSPSLLLALDIGTSSVRSAYFDQQGRRVSGSLFQETYPLHTDTNGMAEIEPYDLEMAARSCLQRTQESRPQAQLLGVGISCFWHSLIALDRYQAPLTRIITWADSRCREDAARLQRELDEAEYHQRTGAMLRTSFWLPKLAWLKRTQPGIFRKARTWMSPADWLCLRLCDEWQPGYSMASGTGLFNRHTGTWDEASLELADIAAESLGEISDEPFGMENWFPPIGDGAASNLGCGATAPGIAAINFGTSAAIRTVATGKPPRVPFGLFCYRIDAQRWLVGGAISNAGSARAWATDTLRLPEEPALERALAKRRGPVEGISVLPFFNAERAPTWPDNIPGAIYGLRQSTAPLDVFQAITEASFLRLADIGALLRRHVAHDDLEITVSGGLLKSPSSMQRLADIFGQKIHANTEPEGSLRGAAVFALEQLGIAPKPLRVGKSYPGDPEIHAAYTRKLETQRALEKVLSAGISA